MISHDKPALALAPMDGITDAPMRALQGEISAFNYAVTEFIRVSGEPLPKKVFRRNVPELAQQGAVGPTGLPVQVQILGGDPERMALSAYAAWRTGATAIDINFGCPAPTVNRNDGGASILRCSSRIREIVSAVKQAVPVPVSAKLRLGWEDIDDIDENAQKAAEGGADWLTIHARTRMQGYAPPVYWEPIGRVRKRLGVPVIANGDIWSFEDFLRCRDVTGCSHYMLGRCALANPTLSHQISSELGLSASKPAVSDWLLLLYGLIRWTEYYGSHTPAGTVKRLKQWLKIAASYGDFQDFDLVKQATTTGELLSLLEKESSLMRA